MRDTEYKVKFIKGEEKETVTFTRLPDARRFGLEKYRLGQFLELRTKRGTLLPL